MLLRSSRAAQVVVKEAGFLKSVAGGAQALGKGLWGAGKQVGKTGVAVAGSPLKATGLGLGGLALGGAGINAAKGMSKNMQRPAAQQLGQRRAQGFGKKKMESISGATNRAFGAAASGVGAVANVAGGAKRMLGG